MDTSKPYDRASSFWEDYEANRARVPDSFFDRILAYHNEHGGELGTVHDAGAGPGLHSPRLRSRFRNIVVSDPSEVNIEQARYRLRDQSNCAFRVAEVEDATHIAPASMDMVFAANMLHWTDLNRAMEAVAAQLRPGGTFVASFFCHLAFEDPILQDLWQKIMIHGNELLLSSKDFHEKAKTFLPIMASDYDLVPIDTETEFRPHPLRVRINHINGWTLYDSMVPPGARGDLPKMSRVGPGDEILFETDENWRVRRTFEEIQKLVRTIIEPRFEDEESAMLFRELEEAIGGGEVEAVWPVILILATKREV